MNSLFLGESFSIQLLNKLSTLISPSCQVWNLYGPAETTIYCTFRVVDIRNEADSIPIGLPFPNYQCVIKDNFLQDVIINQEGELFVGGVGVFAGYLERDDLTEKVLIAINGEMFYRTGDLVRMDNNGLLHYKGRKDHQIKLHGQRIELGEIERCLLKMNSISGCVVMKWGDNHLVGYVQSSTVSEDELRHHCQSYLPPHMIPSKFIVLEQFPLNPNGKTDRKRLPTPEFSSHLTLSINDDSIEPSDELELYIHSLWCQTLSHTQISTNVNFFHVGGHSLLLVQLYHKYKMTLNIQMNNVGIKNFLQYPSIADHTRLIREAINNENMSLHILTTEGRLCYNVFFLQLLSYFIRRNIFYSKT